MSKNTEKVISTILLKYYKIPQKSDTSMPHFKCAYCLNKSNRSGGGFLDEKETIHQICENCAIKQYKKEKGFKTLKAAEARRRRMFDVGYLFNEIVMDIYMEIKGIKDIEDCENADNIFIKSIELFNYLFSKEQKIELEEIELQEDIEKKIKSRIAIVDLGKFFIDL